MGARVQIFLSYAREDKEQVENLYQRLSSTGLKPWMDTKDILPGEIWETCIRRAVRNSDFFLACLSTNSVGKRGFVQKEIRDALNIWQEKLEDDIDAREGLAVLGEVEGTVSLKDYLESRKESQRV